jgi:S1-C subfamily serine protease
VLITQIQPVSPAERAGMMTGDIVVRADNKLVRSVNEFKEVLKTKKPGQDISLMLWREDRKVEITLKVSQKSVAP